MALFFRVNIVCSVDGRSKRLVIGGFFSGLYFDEVGYCLVLGIFESILELLKCALNKCFVAK